MFTRSISIDNVSDICVSYKNSKQRSYNMPSCKVFTQVFFRFFACQDLIYFSKQINRQCMHIRNFINFTMYFFNCSHINLCNCFRKVKRSFVCFLIIYNRKNISVFGISVTVFYCIYSCTDCCRSVKLLPSVRTILIFNLFFLRNHFQCNICNCKINARIFIICK